MAVATIALATRLTPPSGLTCRCTRGALPMTPPAAATQRPKRCSVLAPAAAVAASGRSNAGGATSSSPAFPKAPAHHSPAGLSRKTRPGSSAAVATRGRSRQAVVSVRADVNWDAFRPTLGGAGSGAGSSASGGVLLPGAGASTAWFGNQPVPAAAASSLQPQGSVHQVDFLVLGSGIAGLTYALKVAEYGSVAVVTKDSAHEGCTHYAQGGVCAVLDRLDSVAVHVRDTMVAGAFLNDPQAVEVVCREGPARVLELAQLGAEFTTNDDGSFHLTKEGGHSVRRVVHAADMTGREVERALLAAARAHCNIRFYEHHLATELVVDEYAGVRHCFGADVLDQRTLTMTRFVALSTMLACGGAGQIYPNTTNPHVATGDGIAMAYRAHASVSNMEFVQFHPTALHAERALQQAGGRIFLITEAVRGEGGVLLNGAGERFMHKYDAERLELAPRDVVARSIHHELMERGEQHVLLDISHKPRDEVLHHFPNINAKCLELGIDMTREPIPVVPAQHYTCGGVQTGLLGETTVQGLFAAGEVACSGLHGANRLASNSLLEGLVFADRAVNPSVAHAEHALRSCGRQLHYAAAAACFTGTRAARAATPALAAWAARRRAELRQAMWRGCGIVRHMQEVARAGEEAAAVAAEAEAALRTWGICTDLVELHNLAQVAGLVTACAAQRRESRGGHYCLDWPAEREEERRPSLVTLAPVVAVPAGSGRVSGPLVPMSPRGGGRRAVAGGGGGGKKVLGSGGAAGGSGKAERRESLVTRSMPPNEAR